MIEPEHPLFSLVERGYAVFKYQSPNNLGVCTTCCMCPLEVQDMLQAQVHEIPLLSIDRWYMAALSGTLTREVWGYLMPRILEILATGKEVCSLGNEIVLARFSTGNATLWRPEEWSVLADFQQQHLRWSVGVRPHEMDTNLCMYNLGGWPLAGLWEQVLKWPDGLLVEALWESWWRLGYIERSVTSFWPNEKKEQITALYSGPELRERVESIALSTSKSADKALELANVWW